MARAGANNPNKNFDPPKKITKKPLLFMWRYLKRRKWLLIISLVLSIATVLASLLATSLQQPMIDDYIHPAEGSTLTTEERIAGVTKSIAVIGAIYLLNVAAMYFQNRMLVRLSQQTINEIRKDLFAHLQTLPVRYYDSTTRGELMSRFTNDCETMSDALQNSITSLFSSIITLVGILFLMFKRSAPLTLINLFAIPLLMFIVSGIMKKSRAYFKKRQAALGVLNGFVEETVVGQKVVKVFSHETQAIEQFDELNRELKRTNETALIFGGMMMPISRSLNNIVYATIATVGGVIAIGTGNLSIGALVVFLSLSSQFGRPINEIANQYVTIASAASGAERICEVMEQQPEGDDGEYRLVVEDGKNYWDNGENRIEVKGDVRFSNVDFGYEPDKQVLYDLSLYAKPSQKIAFVGSTGAGKTTIINLLARFYDITDGEILIDGLKSTDITRKGVREAMAVVLQDTHLFTGTVRDNIRYGRLDATDEEIENAARLTHAHSFIRRLPQGYDTMIEGDGSNLSQGQRQLLNITRAAVAATPILVLDEATSSVDTRTERQIEKGLDSLMEDRTTYIIAHRLSTVRNANAIMVLERGRIIERGTHEQLLALGGRYHELYTGKLELD